MWRWKNLKCLATMKLVVVSFSQRVCTARPRTLMRWWMGAYETTEALYPLVADNLSGDSSNVGLHSDAPSPNIAGVRWRWMEVIISSTCPLPRVWLRCVPVLVMCLHGEQMFKSTSSFYCQSSDEPKGWLSHIIRLQQHCCNHLTQKCHAERLILHSGAKLSNH